MANVTLGRTGIVVEQNGFGALPIQRVGFEEAGKLLNRALDGGMNLIDPARAYSDSEEKIGRAIAHRRQEYTLATKTGATTPEGFRRSLDEVLSMGADNITVHTLSLKKGSRITLESRIPSADEVAEMLDYADPTLRKHGFEPYYLYRQKYMSGSFENVGWTRPGGEGLYNIYIMEELHSILSLGAGGSTKMVGGGLIRRAFNAKYPREYIDLAEKRSANLAAFADFYREPEEHT